MPTEQELEAFVLKMNCRECEPYLTQIPKDQSPWESCRVKKVSTHWQMYQTVHTESGGGFSMPILNASQRRVVPGDWVHLYGKGMGYSFSGLRVNDEVIYWRTPEMQEQHHRRMCEINEAERERHRQSFVPDPSWRKPLRFKDAQAEADFEKTVQGNNKDSYSYATVCFATQWGHIMDQILEANPKIEVASIAKRAQEAALKMEPFDGLTGNMMGYAVAMLSQWWEHGDALRVWHNLDTQIGTEGEEANRKGTTLNPAVFLMGGPA